MCGDGKLNTPDEQCELSYTVSAVTDELAL